MPIYAFACHACGHQFDRLQKLSDPDPDVCPECGAADVRRQLTAPAFRLAGSGWYETDFKKDGDRKRNLADRAEPAKGEGTPGTPATSAGGDKAASSTPAEKPAAVTAAPGTGAG